MREMGLEAWKWASAGVLMGLLTLMMVLGLGKRRGTRLNRLRISIWILVTGLGAATTAYIPGCADCYDRVLPDTSNDAPVDEDPEEGTED